jgi:CBS domain-containing protein
MDMKVAEVMTPDPVCAIVPGTREELFELIRETGKTSFPVTKGKNGDLIGIVTETDIVNKRSETQIALLMTKNPQTVTPDTKVSEVVKILIKNNFRQMPVMKKNKLVGMIDIGDIISKVVSIDTSKKTIEEYMSEDIMGIWQETPVYICQHLMKIAKAESALIFDNDLNMVGIITNVDFINVFESQLSENRSEMSSGEGKEGSWDSVSTIIVQTKDLFLPKYPAKELMTTNVITTFKKATLNAVAKKIHRMKLYQIPVVDAKGNVIGMIRDVDLLKAYFNDND